MTQRHINEVRAFNRFYTVFIGVLNRSYLNTRYSLPESRVLHATYSRPGLTPSEIIGMLNIDKSYLSRILINLEKRKLLTRKQAAGDKRAVNLYLTALGNREFEKIDTAANQLVKKLMASLNDKDCDTVVKSMMQIREILSGSKEKAG